MRKRLQRASFFINKHLHLICFAIALAIFAIVLAGILVVNDFGSLGIIDGLLVILIPAIATFGFYFSAREMERWLIRTQTPKHQAIENQDNTKTERRVVEGGEGAYEAAEFQHANLPRLHDEDHWTKEDDLELERRMKKWKKNI